MTVIRLWVAIMRRRRAENLDAIQHEKSVTANILARLK